MELRLHLLYGDFCMDYSWFWNISFRNEWWIGSIATFTIVNLTWVFFRADSLEQSLTILSGFNLNFDFISKAVAYFAANNEFREAALSLLVCFPFFILFEVLISQTDFNKVIEKKTAILRWSIYLIMAFMILVFGVLNSAPQFIYFQF